MTATMTPGTLSQKNLLTLADLTGDDIRLLLNTAAATKANPESVRDALAHKAVVLLFEKPSLRTRMSFEVGVFQLGGLALYLDHRLGKRESVRDYAKNLERWTHGIVLRTFSHTAQEEFAAESDMPVINGLSDLYHPCQALADYFTLSEHLGSLDGAKLAYVGDGNNVCHSLMIGAAQLGLTLTVVTPDGFEPNPDVASKTQALAAASGASVSITTDLDAAADHHAVYTDTWVSMGQDHEAEERRKAFMPYQVNAKVMSMVGADSLFMHCLPAHRGFEVTDDVIDSSRSVVYDQAENRMHVQNALMIHTIGVS